MLARQLEVDRAGRRARALSCCLNTPISDRVHTSDSTRVRFRTVRRAAAPRVRRAGVPMKTNPAIRSGDAAEQVAYCVRIGRPAGQPARRRTPSRARHGAGSCTRRRPTVPVPRAGSCAASPARRAPPPARAPGWRTASSLPRRAPCNRRFSARRISTSFIASARRGVVGDDHEPPREELAVIGGARRDRDHLASCSGLGPGATMSRGLPERRVAERS